MLSTGLSWPRGSAAPLPSPARRDAEGSVHGAAVRLRTAVERTALAFEWQALAARSHGGFFTTWAWIESWLHGLPGATPLWLLRAVRDGQVIGLGLVTRGPHRRLRGLPFVTAWHLHASGHPGLDGICIEHNDFLVAADHAASARQALVGQWLQLSRGARELHLPHLGELPGGQAWAEALQPPGRTLRVLQHSKPSYSVDLAAVRAHDHDLLALCSAQLRSQVRRSLRAYEALGELRLEAAPDTPTALAWLDRLAQLHQAHWSARGQPGAFATPSFVAFHRHLIRQAGTEAHQPTHVQMLRLCAGGHELAYLYNLVHRGRVCFYQSGLDYGAGGKHARPGYVAHVLAIERNARLGHAVYDFMMGDTRYKRDLATHRQHMHSLVLQPPALRLAVESLLRRVPAAARVPGESGPGAPRQRHP